MKLKLLVLALFCTVLTYAQSTVTGTVTDSDNLPLPGVNVNLVGSQYGTVTDIDGKFELSAPNNPPFTIEFSSIGFENSSVNVSQKNQTITVRMQEEDSILDEIVVSASRTPERVIESPVTIERMGIRDIKNSTAPTFYDGLENMKEVHFNTSSMSFKTINTRGFASVGNTRFLQLVDGMDNSSPALNFVLGNLVGLNELDVASVELLPGASSALYGANAFNGILFMNSKSPFIHEGISGYYKYGQTSQDVAGTNDYHDWGIRAAKKFTRHFAAKVNFNYMRATEWIADDRRSMTAGGDSHALNQNYDGTNIYGDEITTFITNVGQVSRTGYAEKDLNDNKIENVRADFNLYFRPFDNDLEIIVQDKFGAGTTIYQGANRYKLRNFFMNQARVEVKNRNFFVRAYMTSENAGDSYDMRFTGWNINRQAKSDVAWFTDYATAYQLSSAVLGLNTADAAGYARQFADYNESPGLGLTPNGSPRFMPGSPEFVNAFNNVVSNPDLTTGSKFQDNSRIYRAEANYNFKEVIDWAEIQVGGSFQRFDLNSYGTIFTDYDGGIRYNEYGAYAQLQKKFMDDRLKFTGSARYDKSQNFDGFVSPRVAFVYSAGENRLHNIRLSFQTGFRNPTTQDQYIGLDVGPFALIGSAPDNLTRFQETVNISQASQQLGMPATADLNGLSAYQNAYTLESVTRFGQTQNPFDLQVAEINTIKPEQVKAFELGYRTVINNDFSIDANVYYNIYNDFINQARVITPYYGQVSADPTNPATQLTYQALAFGDRRVYQVYTNTNSEVTSLGFGIGLSKNLPANFEVGVNYNYAEFDYNEEDDPAFVPGFNTPKHRFKASLGNPKLFKNFGFNVNYRWTDEYVWQSSFGDGIIPETNIFDAQVNYTVPAWKMQFKAGASNIGGKDYLQVIGSGMIGSMWYGSIIINP